ncbi:MAG: AGE family epimerase/isomerase [bacterium]
MRLADKIMQYGFDRSRGAWFDKIDSRDLSRHGNRVIWWIQAYGNMLHMTLYRCTGNRRYIDDFQKGAQFWNSYLLDKEHGDTYLSVDLEGRIVDGTKANRFKASYHNMEHCFLNYLALEMWLNHNPVQLHYSLTSSQQDDKLYPILLEDPSIHIGRVTINGKEWNTIDRRTSFISLPRQNNLHVVTSMSR